MAQTPVNDDKPQIAIRDDTRVPGEVPPPPNPAAPKINQEPAIEHEPEHPKRSRR